MLKSSDRSVDDYCNGGWSDGHESMLHTHFSDISYSKEV